MMKEIQISDYTQYGLKINWEKNFEIKATIQNNKVCQIKLNKAGLISMAKLMLSLAEEKVPLGYHVHLDEMNSLEDGSAALIIEKM